ncbi:AraC family transcriptional regulator [Aureimonas ureilytica]|uniref:AraC family transcriptional regulator n=1 Tax=Aureimonas ureilytica TaxID=401562 RepID=UPI00037D197D|nr:AraC family transcriptional regulator [Aureimonas ureilytica]
MTGTPIATTIALPDGLNAEETFEHWRLAVASIFEAQPAATDYRESFRGRLLTHHLGRFLIGTSSNSPLRTRRDEALVGAVGVDHILFQLYEKGEGEFEAEGRDGRVKAGDLVCFDLSRRHAATLSKLDTVSIVMPRTLIHLPPRTIDTAHGMVIDGASPIGALLGQQLTALAATAARVTASDLDPITSFASTLLSVGLSVAGRGKVEDPAGVLALTLSSIRAHIENNLADPALSIDSISRHFGLSRSALYRIFEPLGGIADYIRDRRLERAALRLASVGMGRGAVARLGLACGFPSEASFSRAFRNRYGLTPREAILKARLRIDEAAADALEAEQNWIQAWLEDLASGRNG